MIGSCAFILTSQLVWIIAVILRLNDPERLAKRAENIKKRTMARKQLNAAKIAARTAEKQMELERQRANAPTTATKERIKNLEQRQAELTARVKNSEKRLKGEAKTEEPPFTSVEERTF